MFHLNVSLAGKIDSIAWTDDAGCNEVKDISGVDPGGVCQ